MRAGCLGMVTFVPSSSVTVRGNEGCSTAGEGLGEGVAAMVGPAAVAVGEAGGAVGVPPAVQAPARSAAASAAADPRADKERPFRRDGEGVGSGERSMVPALSREGGGHDRGPGDRTSSAETLVTVAGLCRIRTGFADPRSCVMSCPRSLHRPVDRPISRRQAPSATVDRPLLPPRPPEEVAPDVGSFAPPTDPAVRRRRSRLEPGRRGRRARARPRRPPGPPRSRPASTPT